MKSNKMMRLRSKDRKLRNTTALRKAQKREQAIKASLAKRAAAATAE